MQQTRREAYMVSMLDMALHSIGSDPLTLALYKSLQTHRVWLALLACKTKGSVALTDLDECIGAMPFSVVA